METADDSAFLRDLLEMLDGTDAAQPLAEDAVTLDDFLSPLADESAPAPTTRERAARTTSAARMKRALNTVRAEAASLTEQLERLRAAHGAQLAVAKERAITERRKRQRAEAECCQLREAVYAQRRFIRGLRSVFSATPRFALGLDLCRYLHRHTRLARNRDRRWSEFDVDAHNTRMRAAMDMLCHETAAVSLSDSSGYTVDPTHLPGEAPFINGEVNDSGECLTKTSMAVYALDTTDLRAVVRATCVAIRGAATICGFSGDQLSVSRDIIDVDASPESNLLYRVLAVRHPCASLNDALSIETRIMTSYKITDDYAVVLWDFVDVDELYPTSETTHVTRQVTGACLIRREWCDRDGVERTAFRSLATKKFRFRTHESAAELRRFECISLPTVNVRGNELVFRRIVMDQLAAERAIDTQTRRAVATRA